MADINIQRKKRPLWPWILAVLVAGLLIWLLIRSLRQDEQVPRDTSSAIPMLPLHTADTVVADTTNPHNWGKRPATVVAYANFVRDSIQTHTYFGSQHVASGIRLMASALTDLSRRHLPNHTETLNQIEALRLQMDINEQNHHALQETADLKRIFSAATDVCAAIQQKDFPKLENQVTELRKVAAKINKNLPIVNQQEKVSAFFGQSSNLLQAMTENTNPQPQINR